MMAQERTEDDHVVRPRIVGCWQIGICLNLVRLETLVEFCIERIRRTGRASPEHWGIQ